MKVYNLLNSKFIKNDLVKFWEENDHLFVDPFSNHVNISNYIDKLLSKGKIIIAVDNNIIIGFVCFYSNDKNNSIGHIQSLLVDSNHRNKGVGAMLLDGCLMEMKEEGMKKCILTVDNSNNAAISLYIKYGFTMVGFNKENNTKSEMSYIINNYERY